MFPDIIVNDETIDETKKQIKALCSEINNTHLNYSNYLQQVLECGIASGEGHDALMVLKGVSDELSGEYLTAADTIGLALDAFKYNIDAADDYLY